MIQSGKRTDGLKAADIVPILRERVAYLSGGRDKRGGAILTFPSRTHPERHDTEDLRRLMTYLASVPSDDVRDRGFTIILDMRGSTWQTVKPILKVLQECFPGNIHIAYIIKPEKFWEKQRTSLGSAKYNFEMFEWISHNRDLFLVNYTEIGNSHQMAVELETEHSQFANSAVNVYVNITRILGMAQRLCDAGHYASNTIRMQANRLEREWKSLAAALEDRSAVLTLSVMFFKKAEQYLAQVVGWRQACENPHIPNDIEELENALQLHQGLIEAISQSYAEVCGDGKQLLDTLQTPVSSNSMNSLTAKADYSEASGNVLDVVHEVLAHQRHLEQTWHSKKVKLHQRLGLRLFQQDVKQVIDWLDNHGDGFLRKNTSVGRSLQRAKALQKSHEHFESVAQLTSWLEELQQELQSSEIADSVEGAEQLLGQFNAQRETTIEAAINTVSEGENLLEQLR
ncbi:hypothetical protein KUTeg_002207 [Tegillarca granosa]|uniref:CRAL-TRIO domain-containing protein n=1 Tax=Tegillarca granosa TaxID=220873 RepID=A0ABQ9FWG1_TEGGR|nr:hypothetical protein KUTeg_002207 [Tegillarca granosa]